VAAERATEFHRIGQASTGGRKGVQPANLLPGTICQEVIPFDLANDRKGIYVNGHGMASFILAMGDYDSKLFLDRRNVGWVRISRYKDSNGLDY